MSTEQALRELDVALRGAIGDGPTATLLEQLPIMSGTDPATKQDVGALGRDVGDRFARVDDRFERVDVRFERVEGRLAGIEDHLARLDIRLDGMTSTLEERMDRHLDRRFTDFERHMDANMDAKLGRLQEHLTAVFANEIAAAVVGQTRAMIFALTGALVGLGGLALVLASFV